LLPGFESLTLANKLNDHILKINCIPSLAQCLILMSRWVQYPWTGVRIILVYRRTRRIMKYSNKYTLWIDPTFEVTSLGRYLSQVVQTDLAYQTPFYCRYTCIELRYTL
jgi:hypothetical protein